MVALLVPVTVHAAEVEHAGAIRQARMVMDQFMDAFNARQAAAWADTLLFPHVRIAGGDVVVHRDRAEFISRTDFAAFAQQHNWQHSAWDNVEVMQAGPDKVHFRVVFSRFGPQGERNATYRSLYVLQRVNGRWGIRARSSFAP